jgi:hypothetical protein
VDDAVDEQGRRAHHLARGQAAVDIAADPVRHRDAGPVPVERRYVQAEPGGVAAQVTVLERLLPVEKQLVQSAGAASGSTPDRSWRVFGGAAVLTTRVGGPVFGGVADKAISLDRGRSDLSP